MKLGDIARATVQDRGVLIEVSIVASDARDYRHIERQLTAGRVRAHLAGRIQKPVLRFARPHLGALTFVLWPTPARGPSIRSMLLQMDVAARTALRLVDDRPARVRVC